MSVASQQHQSAEGIGIKRIALNWISYLPDNNSS